MRVLFAHLQEPPPDLSELRPDIPAAAAQAINRALEKEPEDRPASAAGYVQLVARAAGAVAKKFTFCPPGPRIQSARDRVCTEADRLLRDPGRGRRSWSSSSSSRPGATRRRSPRSPAATTWPRRRRRCTGLQMDVTQSGQFVGLRRPDGTVLSQARLRDGRLKGDVQCIGGGERALVATVAVKGVLAGTLGGVPLRAELKRDPPPPGALRPRPPPSIAGDYKLSPRSDCLGGAARAREGRRAPTRSRAGSGAWPTATVRSRGASCAATRACARSPGRRPTATSRSTCRPAAPARPPEKVVATKQRDFTATGRRLLPRRRRGHALRAPHGRGGRALPPAARDGRGARRDPPRADGLRAAVPRPAARALPERRHPAHRRGRQPRADLLHVPRRARARPLAAARAPRPDRGDLQHRRRHPDARRASPSRCRPTR